jgi:hypothetical protein
VAAVGTAGDAGSRGAPRESSETSSEIATDANTGRKLVLYRPRGAHPPDMIALDLAQWREAIAAGVLSLVTGAKP